MELSEVQCLVGRVAAVDAGCVDRVALEAAGREVRRLKSWVEGREVLVARLLAGVSSFPEKSVGDAVRRLETDRDADARFERQRRAVRLNSWIDRVTGMGRWSVSWDPETMVRLENRLDAQVHAMFHDVEPEGCPTDPLEKQAYLRALALQALLTGDGVRLGRPEIVVVVDHTQPHPDGRPTTDWVARRHPPTSPRRPVSDRGGVSRRGP